MDPTWHHHHHHHHHHPYYNHPPPPPPPLPQGGAPPPPPPPPPTAHGTICPICSYHHFPFCPRPHHPQFYPRPPHHYHPPPPPTPPAYDPFVDPHRPSWSPHGVPYANNEYGSAKRLRLDDSSGVDDQRRLRLIRDHGGSAGDTLLHTNVGNDRIMAGEFRSPDDRFVKRSVPLPLPVEYTPPSLFPILPSSSAAGAAPALYPPAHLYGSGGSAPEQTPYKAHFAGSEAVSRRPLSPEKPKVIDVSYIIKHPHRTTRPDHIVVILRGLPGSGKSYLAKMLRDLEVENGGNNPRIHSMDDYFMTEVEKVEEIEVSKSGGTARGKKAVTKKVMEYSYEPEMEEAYRSSMLKAFKKSLDDGTFNFIIVDDRNLRVADFAQFWATAKRAGYEVYLLEAAYKDPAGCAARNVHGFTLDDIQKMADLWEETPALYLKLDIKSLLHGDRLENNAIQEVDMDMGDEDPAGGHDSTEESYVEKLVVPSVRGTLSDEDDDKWEPDTDQPQEEVKELGKSKWSNDFDEDDIHKNKANGNSTAASGLLRSHNNVGKSVRWGDQAGNSGFSIIAAKSFNTVSLVIGPGAGYNMKSNPLSDEEKITSARSVSRKQNVFEERLRAERESFKAIFDKRKERISGFSGED